MRDVEGILAHLRTLEEALADWRRYREELSPETLAADRDRQRSVFHAMLVAIQAAIDIAHHLIAEGGWPRPETYREAFEILAGEGVIPEALGERLADLAGFRNVLVHGYWRLDLQRVWELLQQAGDPLREFEEIAGRLCGEETD